MFNVVQVITFPTAVEDLLLSAININKYAVYVILLAALLAISKVSNTSCTLQSDISPLVAPWSSCQPAVAAQLWKKAGRDSCSNLVIWGCMRQCLQHGGFCCRPQVTGALADLGGPLAPLFWLLSAVSFLLVPLELFEVCGGISVLSNLHNVTM